MPGYVHGRRALTGEHCCSNVTLPWMQMLLDLYRPGARLSPPLRARGGRVHNMQRKKGLLQKLKENAPRLNVRPVGVSVARVHVCLFLDHCCRLKRYSCISMRSIFSMNHHPTDLRLKGHDRYTRPSNPIHIAIYKRTVNAISSHITLPQHALIACASCQLPCSAVLSQEASGCLFHIH